MVLLTLDLGLYLIFLAEYNIVTTTVTLTLGDLYCKVHPLDGLANLVS